MKKYLILASAALVALAACNKEVEISNPVNQKTEKALIFTSQRPQLDADTKTAWDNETSSIVWQATDKIKVGFTFNDAWWAQTTAYSSDNATPNNHIKFYQSEEVSIDESSNNIGTFVVPETFTGPTTEGSFVFYAVYPSALVDNSLDTAPSATVTLKASQSPAANSFDASTDIMVGTSDVITSTGLPEDAIELNWNRVVAHVALTFSNMAFEGTETPTKITLTFNDDAKVAGSFSVNIADGSIGAGTANVISLEGNGLTVSENSIGAWATVLPVSFTSLNVEIKTDKATYVREITGLSKTFKKNARNTLTINMKTASRSASEQYDWVKKNLSEIMSSDVFVIVGNNGDDYAMSNSNGTNSAPAAVAVTVANNKLSVAPAESIQWTLSGNATDGYTFYPNGTTETWLYVFNNNNGLRVGTGADKAFTLSDGYLHNTGQNRYIGIYISQDWRSYTSINNNIKDQTFAFYVKSTATPSKPVPTISFDKLTTEVNIGETVTNVATIDPSTLTITYSSSDDDIATVSDAGVVTGVSAGTATITASFAGDETYDEASAEYEITVIDPNATANDGTFEHPYTASEARELALSGDNGSYFISGIVTKIQNQYDANYGTANFWIDEEGASQSVFEGYKIKYFGDVNWVEGNAKIAVNDEVIIYGALTVYNTTPETSSGYLVSLNGKTKGLTPGTLTATPDNDNKQITVSWGAATGTESAISYVVSCGTQTYNASAAGSHTFTMSDYGQYNVSVIASADDAISGIARTTVTLSDPNSETPTLQYTLDGTDSTQGSNGYATNSEITQSNIGWIAVANTTISPWRFGGKNLSGVDRAVYSTTAIASNISSIEVESGSATATVNSLTITVHNSASDAASGSNPIATKTVTSDIIDATVTLTKEDDTSWAGKYYRIVYNVTAGGSNQYVQFKSAKFYGFN